MAAKKKAPAKKCDPTPPPAPVEPNWKVLLARSLMHWDVERSRPMAGHEDELCAALTYAANVLFPDGAPGPRLQRMAMEQKRADDARRRAEALQRDIAEKQQEVAQAIEAAKEAAERAEQYSSELSEITGLVNTEPAPGQRTAPQEEVLAETATATEKSEALRSADHEVALALHREKATNPLIPKYATEHQVRQYQSLVGSEMPPAMAAAQIWGPLQQTPQE